MVPARGSGSLSSVRPRHEPDPFSGGDAMHTALGLFLGFPPVHHYPKPLSKPLGMGVAEKKYKEQCQC